MELLREWMLESPLCNVFEVLPIAAVGMGIFWMWKRDWAAALLAGYLTAIINIVCTPAYFWNTFWRCLWYGEPLKNVAALAAGEWLQGGFYFPLRPVSYFFTSGSWTRFMYLSNILLFVPFGILYPRAKKCGFWKTLGVGCAAGIVMELIQPIMGRCFDTNDLAAYFLGLLLGCVLYFGITHLKKRLRPQSS